MNPLPLDPENTRRDFLRKLSAASLAALGSGAPVASAETIEHPAATADSCIILWMAGGMAAPETFDPKRYQPFVKGVPVGDILSTFPSIDTSVDSIKICAGLENVAKVMDRATLIRSAIQPDLGSILHSRHQYHWHTGYVPPQTVAAPHIGAWMSKVLGPRNAVMPAFINVGQRLEGIGESEELKSFTTGGFFGTEHGPMNLPFPSEAMRAVRPPEGMGPSRFANRRAFFKKLVDNSPHRDLMSDHQQRSMMRSLESAHKLLSSPEAKAFDLELESEETRAAYGDSRFGQGCLLARNLVEKGARFVEVTTEYVPFFQWDTHKDGHEVADRMHKEVDAPVARLILDLEERGLLDRTLVVIASEFSRDAMIEGVPGSDAKDQATVKSDTLEIPAHYGLHRHFTGGTSVVMFGGGVKKGFVYGKTADERPLIAVENPVTISDLHATIFTAMGISPETMYEIERRPFYATEDGKGSAIREVFA